MFEIGKLNHSFTLMVQVISLFEITVLLLNLKCTIFRDNIRIRSILVYRGSFAYYKKCSTFITLLEPYTFRTHLL